MEWLKRNWLLACGVGVAFFLIHRQNKDVVTISEPRVNTNTVKLTKEMSILDSIYRGGKSATSALWGTVWYPVDFPEEGKFVVITSATQSSVNPEDVLITYSRTDKVDVNKTTGNASSSSWIQGTSATMNLSKFSLYFNMYGE